MKIIISDASAHEALELVRQLAANNRYIIVESVRRQPNSQKFRVTINGAADYIGLTDDIDTVKQAADALRETVDVYE